MGGNLGIADGYWLAKWGAAFTPVSTVKGRTLLPTVALLFAAFTLTTISNSAFGFSDDFSGSTPDAFWATNGYTNNYYVETPEGPYQTNVVILPTQPNSALTQAGGALSFTSALSSPSFALWTAVVPPSASGDWHATLRVANYKTGVNGFASIGLVAGKYGYIADLEAAYVDSPRSVPLASLVGFSAALTATSTEGVTDYRWEAGAPRVYGSSGTLTNNGIVSAYSALYSNTSIGTTGVVGAVVTNNGVITDTAFTPSSSNAYVYRPLSSAEATSVGEVRLSYAAQQLNAFYRESTNGSWVPLASVHLSDLGMSNSSEFSLGIYGASIGETVFAEGMVSADNFSLVPEPSAYALLAMSAAGALWWARRRR